MTRDRFSSFRSFALATVVAVYFLILVGGVVRASGAGMGCPDWPKCFDRWVPPTSAAQLPADYQRIYADRGYADTEFNAFKTWTEYVNRLVGVLIGFLIFITAVLSWRHRRVHPRVTVEAGLAFLLVGFQGWLGSVVVSSELAPWIVTLHMVLALVIVGLLIDAVMSMGGGGALRATALARRRIRWWLVGAGLLSLVQIAWGTQVREAVDHLAVQGVVRSRWMNELGTLVLGHRSMSLLLLAVNLGLVLAIRRYLPVTTTDSSRETLVRLRGISIAIAGVVAAEIIAGATMFYLSIPTFLQPVHLLLAALLAGLQLALWVAVRANVLPEYSSLDAE